MENEEQVYLNEQNLKDIGDALRNVNGTNTRYKPRDMAPAIMNLTPGDDYMLKSVYDTNDDGVVDNAELVNGHTVDKDVPADAEFTDTLYDDTELRELIDTKQDEEQVKQLIVEGLAGFDKIKYEKVEELPVEGEDGVRYLIPVPNEDKYEVWIYMDNTWSSLGSTSDLNLDGYVTHNDLEERLEEELPKKQDKLVAGENITLTPDEETGEVEISSENTVYTAGNENVEIDAENLTISTKDTTYTAGENVEIVVDEETGENVINATDTVYGAGTGIFIDEENIISDIPYTAGEGIEITDQRVIKNIMDMTNYYDKSQVDDIISNLDTLSMRVVEELPTIGLGHIVYMVEAGENLYNQWVFSQGEWYQVGNTSINLTDYYTKTQCDNKFQELLTEVEEPEEVGDDTTLSFVDLQNNEVTPISLPKIADYMRGSSDIQRSTMPEVTEGLAGAVIQYIGSDETTYKTGRWYKAISETIYAWIAQTTANTYYTLKQTPIYNDIIYAYTEGEPLEPTVWKVGDVTGNVMTDKNGNRYTRVSVSDISGYKYWKALEYRTSDFVNDGRGTQADKDYFITKLDLTGAISLAIENDFTGNRALVSTPQGKISYSNITAEELNRLSGVTSNVQTQIDGKQKKFTAGTAISSVSDTTKISQVDITNSKSADMTAKTLFNYMWKKIYPVGSIYTTTDKSFNPGTSFGGTWVHIGVDRVLWGVATNVDGGSTLSEQLPDIRGHIDWKDGGQAKTEISNGSGAFNLTNKNLGAAYPTGAGASNSARGFDFRASYYTDVYKLNASVRPNAYTVHFWRRTA